MWIYVRVMELEHHVTQMGGTIPKRHVFDGQRMLGALREHGVG